MPHDDNSGDRAAADFFAGDRRTALEPGEIVTAVTFHVMHKAAYIKFLNPAARYAIVGVSRPWLPTEVPASR